MQKFKSVNEFKLRKLVNKMQFLSGAFAFSFTMAAGFLYFQFQKQTPQNEKVNFADSGINTNTTP